MNAPKEPVEAESNIDIRPTCDPACGTYAILLTCFSWEQSILVSSWQTIKPRQFTVTEGGVSCFDATGGERVRGGISWGGHGGAGAAPKGIADASVVLTLSSWPSSFASS